MRVLPVAGKNQPTGCGVPIAPLRCSMHRILIAFLLLGCSHAAPSSITAPQSQPSSAMGTPPASRPAVTRDPRYYVAEGAPDPLLCAADKECIGDVVVDSTGCCVVAGEPLPQTWAWHTWVTERRLSDACHDVHCAPLPVPSMPRACSLRARCLAGRCAASCSDASEPPIGRPATAPEPPQR